MVRGGLLLPVAVLQHAMGEGESGGRLALVVGEGTRAHMEGSRRQKRMLVRATGTCSFAGHGSAQLHMRDESRPRAPHVHLRNGA